MDKINPLGIQRSQQQLLQEMHRMAAGSGSSMTPAVNPLSFSVNSAVNGLSQHNASNVDFSQAMKQAVNSVNQQQLIAGAKQEALEMGLSDDLMGTMLESQKASISFSAMLEVRNKLTSALDQIMNISL